MSGQMQSSEKELTIEYLVNNEAIIWSQTATIQSQVSSTHSLEIQTGQLVDELKSSPLEALPTNIKSLVREGEEQSEIWSELDYEELHDEIHQSLMWPTR